VNRRLVAQALVLLAAGSLTLVGCSSDSGATADASSTASPAASAGASAQASGNSTEDITPVDFCVSTSLIWNPAVQEAAKPTTAQESQDLIMQFIGASQTLNAAPQLGALTQDQVENIQRTTAISLLLVQNPEMAKAASSVIAEASGMTAEKVDEAKTEAFKTATNEAYKDLGTYCMSVAKTMSPSAEASAESSASSSAS